MVEVTKYILPEILQYMYKHLRNHELRCEYFSSVLHFQLSAIMGCKPCCTWHFVHRKPGNTKQILQLIR